MAPNKVFKFHQRSGKLDFAALRKIKVDDILANGSIGDLQHVLDNVIFADVSKSALMREPAESVEDLVKTMQLMLEYLLHGQEHQAGLVTKMHAKYEPLKKKAQRLETENVFMKEDIKVYKRQLHGLRQRLQAEGKDTDLDPDYGLQIVEVPAPAPAPAPAEEKKEEEKDPLNHKDIELRLLISRLFEQQRELIEDRVVGHSGRGGVAESLNARMDEMQTMLMATIEAMQQGGGGADAGVVRGASPHRKKARSGSNVDSEDGLLNLSISSNGGSPAAKRGVWTPQANSSSSSSRQSIPHGVMNTARAMGEDLEHEIALEMAKKEAAMAERERNVAEQMARINLIEKSILQSQVVMERERLAIVEERHALTPLKSLKAQMEEIQNSKVSEETMRREQEQRLAVEKAETERRIQAERDARNREVAAKIMKHRFATITWKKLLNRFRKWVQVTLSRRDMEAFHKQQRALEKVKELEEASKAAASESESKEKELLDKLKAEKEEMARRDSELAAQREKEKEEDARRYAALMEEEARRVQEETRKRVEREKERQAEQSKRIAEAAKREINVQTSIDFEPPEEVDHEQVAAAHAMEQLMQGLGFGSGRALSEEGLLRKAEERVKWDRTCNMPSKVQVKEDLEKEMRARLDRKRERMQQQGSGGGGGSATTTPAKYSPRK
jgi:hypothetical protein